jgi:hypothetical protein
VTVLALRLFNQNGFCKGDRDYAQSNSSAYSYAYFSTLYRVWQDEQQKCQPANSVESSTASVSNIAKDLDTTGAPIFDYSADEDHHAELYWKHKVDPRSRTHSLTGHDCSLRVKNGELHSYHTGVQRSFPKITHGLSAIIFLGTAGQITVDAVKWCAAQGVGIYVIGWHGELISVSNTALLPNDKIGETSTLALRRAQFHADPLPWDKPTAPAILRCEKPLCRSSTISRSRSEFRFAIRNGATQRSEDIASHMSFVCP